MRPARPVGLIARIDGKAAFRGLVDIHNQYARLIGYFDVSFSEQTTSKLLLDIRVSFAHFDRNILVSILPGLFTFDKNAQRVRNSGREVISRQLLGLLIERDIRVRYIDGSIRHQGYSLSLQF